VALSGELAGIDLARVPRLLSNLTVPAGLAANADADQLRQVLVNLIANATLAMQGRGHLWLEGETSLEGAA
jgi:signal transduction histidine kinase